MRIIAGRWRGHPLRAPQGRGTRPTPDRVREAWMSAMQSSIPDARVLDLFAGSGALGLESLSRGAAHCTFVEQARAALSAIARNVQHLGVEPERIEVVRGDALTYVRRLDAGAFDIAVADPPYSTGAAQALLDAFEARPFAAQLWLEHAGKEVLRLPDGVRTRRYGDTAITTILGTGEA